MPFRLKKLLRKEPSADEGTAPKSQKKRWKTALKVLAILGVSLGLAGIIAFTLLAAWVSRDLPDPDTLRTRAVPQSTKIFDRTGEVLLYEIHGEENRTLVTIEDIPNSIKHATVAIEDKNFYEHHGVYWRAYFRAAFLSVTKGQRLQGVSTLTQQLVKNAILTNERTFSRKLKEFLLALQIEREYSKDQILQMYLNEIPYGSTIYGIESASQSYFGKRAKELSLDEAALLAAIPQRPDFYNPYGTGSRGDNRKQLTVRQQYILDLMAEQGYISKEEAEAAKTVKTLEKLRAQRITNIKAPHFVMYVRGLLEEQYGVKQTAEGGLRVITSLDWTKQQIAEEEVKKGVEARGKQYSFSNAALISLDPTNGHILAMVGSKDYFDKTIDGQQNVTTNSKRQPGSSFKPIVYAAGFAKGYLPETKLWDVATNFGTEARPYEPKNYDLKENGPTTIRSALQRSLNIPAVKMLYLVGVGRVIDFAEELGYSTFQERSRFGLALVLGGGEVVPLEHAAAYGAFAADGLRHETAPILKVTDPSGQTLQEWKPSEGKQVMDPQVARLISDVMSDNKSRTFGQTVLVLPDRPVAAKTGTTNDFHDAWTAGYTPNLVAVVWVGNNNNDAMKRGADGSIIAAPIWQAYMKRASQGMPVVKFTPPTPPTVTKPAILGTGFEEKVQVDRISNKRATAFTPPEFVEERIAYEPHSILHYVDKDDPQGPPPANPMSDPQYVAWETAVQSWVQRTKWNATSTVLPGFDDVHTPENQPKVTILSPSDQSTLVSRQFLVSAHVQAPRGVVRLEASLNQTPIGISVSAPWTIEARVPGSVPPGYYDLNVTAIDDVGNRGTARIVIQLQPGTSPVPSAGISILSPVGEPIWQRTTFPKTIEVSIPDPENYQRVDAVFYGTDGQRRLADSAFNPTTARVPLRASLGPPAGRYELRIEATRRDGSAETTSMWLNITD